MPKHKAGLHKEVSSIFDGTPIPRDSDVQQSTYIPGLRQNSCDIAEPEASVPQASPASKPQQPVQTVPETTAAEQSKVEAAMETKGPSKLQQSWEQIREQIKERFFTPRPGVNVKKQITMAILIPVLSITLIFVLVRNLRPPARKATKQATAKQTELSSSGSAATEVADEASASGEIDWKIPAPYSSKHRDPMQFGSTTGTVPEETGGLVIKGIVFSHDNPSAVIGNQIVHEGDKILDVTIVKINEKSVEFELNDRKWTQQVQR